jgi:hypothetical protein
MDAPLSRKQFLPVIASALAIPVLTECGGGGGGSNNAVPAASPTPQVGQTPAPGVEGLTDAQAAILDAAPEHGVFDLSQVVLADGSIVSQVLAADGVTPSSTLRRVNSVATTPAQFKRDFLARVINMGNILQNRKLQARLNTVPPQPNGLAYVFGGKSISSPDRGANHGGCCTELLFGLDCSGYVYQCFLAGGLTLPSNIESMFNLISDQWNAIIPAAWGLTEIVKGSGARSFGKVVTVWVFRTSS